MTLLIYVDYYYLTITMCLWLVFAGIKLSPNAQQFKWESVKTIETTKNGFRIERVGALLFNNWNKNLLKNDLVEKDNEAKSWQFYPCFYFLTPWSSPHPKSSILSLVFFFCSLLFKSLFIHSFRACKQRIRIYPKSPSDRFFIFLKLDIFYIIMK